MFKVTYDILDDLEARKCNVASQFCSNSVTNIFENSGTDDLSVCLQDNWTYLSQIPEAMLSRMHQHSSHLEEFNYKVLMTRFPNKA